MYKKVKKYRVRSRIEPDNAELDNDLLGDRSFRPETRWPALPQENSIVDESFQRGLTKTVDDMYMPIDSDMASSRVEVLEIGSIPKLTGQPQKNVNQPAQWIPVVNDRPKQNLPQVPSSVPLQKLSIRPSPSKPLEQRPVEVVTPLPKTSKIISELIMNKFEVLSNFGDSQPKAPQQIFACNNCMKSMLSKFGEIVSFELCKDIQIVENEDHKYVLALLTVFDNNCRPILAGFFLFRREQVSEMFKAIKLMLKVHRKPNAIITSGYPPLLPVMRNLNKLGIFQGLHLIDRESVLEDVKFDLKEIGDRLSETVKTEVLQLCRRITLETNELAAAKLLDQICQKACPAADQLLLRFLQKKGQVCSWAMQSNCFTGLHFSSSQRMSELANEYFQAETSLAKFIEGIGKIQLVLLKDLLEKASFYVEQTQMAFKDDRIGEVRKSVESRIFKCFLRNYILAMKHCQMYKDTNPQTGYESLCVYSKSTRSVYSVDDSSCECNETVRTGIPCPHLICKLKENPSSDYLQYFAIRWRRDANSTFKPKPNFQPQESTPQDDSSILLRSGRRR